MNWGKIIAWTGVVFSVGSSVGYAFHKDVRQAVYFALAAAITVTVIWGR